MCRERLKSDPFHWKGCSWTLLLFISEFKYVSCYLGVTATDDMKSTCRISVNFGFTFESASMPSYCHIDRMDTFAFMVSKEYNDRGFVQCFLLDEVISRVDRDSPCFVRCKASEVLDMTHYSSKIATGMAGLENLGATCYLNALLQVKLFATIS